MKNIYFINENTNKKLNIIAYSHLFLRFDNDEIIINSFIEKGLFTHRLVRGETTTLSLGDIASLRFYKSNGVLYLEIKLDNSSLKLNTKNWKDENIKNFIDLLKDKFVIQNINLYEKYLAK